MRSEFQKSIDWKALYVTSNQTWVAVVQAPGEDRFSVQVIEPADEQGNHNVVQTPIMSRDSSMKAAWQIFLTLPH